MGKNKQQVATEARAKKTTEPAEEQKPIEQAKPAPETKAATPATPTQPTTVSKQQLTIMRLTVALREQRQIEVKPEMLTQDGKFILLRIGKEWPTIQVGNSGGITVVELKSYPKAFEAAIEGDKLLAKQNEREQKKAAAPAPKAAAPEAVTA